MTPITPNGVLVVERHLAIAHKAIWRAAQHMQAMGKDDVYEDLSQMLRVLEDNQVAVLKLRTGRFASNRHRA